MTYEELKELCNKEQKPRRVVKHEEETMQRKCVEHWDVYHKILYGIEDKELLHHSPNGGKRDTKTAANFKLMGTRKGRPDLELNVARQGYHGLFLELKSDTGRLQPEQKKHMDFLRKNGYRCEVIRSKAEFIDILNDYLRNEKK